LLDVAAMISTKMRFSQGSWKLFRFLVLLLVLLLPLCQAARNKRQPLLRRKPVNPNDYYSVLGVAKNASAKQIKSAYRKLALQYHPDKVPADRKEESKDEFVKINEAYDVLGDKTKRQIFDIYGKNGLDVHARGHDPRASGFGGPRSSGGGSSSRQRSSGGGSSSHQSQSGSHSQRQQQRQQQNRGHQQNARQNPWMWDDILRNQQQRHQARHAAHKSGNQHNDRRDYRPNQGGSVKFNFNTGSNKPKKVAAPELFPKDKSKVAKLGKPKFPDEQSKHIWLILFYSNDTEGSQRVAPSYKRLAEQAHLGYKVGAVNCGMSEGQAQFCAGHGVKDFPQFAMVVSGELQRIDVNVQKLSAKTLNDVIRTHLPKDLIQTIYRVAHVEERLLVEKPGVLLLTDKSDVPTMYTSIAYEFRNQFHFGISKARHSKLANEFGIETYPQLLVFVPKQLAQEEFNDENGILRYKGAIDRENIAKWLEGIVKSKTASSQRRRRQRQ
jgi:curved DNA-binding protein CbpA